VTDSINNPEVAMDQNKKWEPSLFRTAIFRLLSGVICLAIIWMLFNEFSWGNSAKVRLICVDRTNLLL